MSLNANRYFGLNSSSQASSMEKLSSGMRINRAGDDAAGLAISEKMRNQIRGLDQGSRNAQDGISLIQTAEGALAESHEMLQRMRELSIQALNDTYTDLDREKINLEVQALLEEMDSVAEKTEFNERKLLTGEVVEEEEEPAAAAGRSSALYDTYSTFGYENELELDEAIADAKNVLVQNLQASGLDGADKLVAMETGDGVFADLDLAAEGYYNWNTQSKLAYYDLWTGSTEGAFDYIGLTSTESANIDNMYNDMRNLTEVKAGWETSADDAKAYVDAKENEIAKFFNAVKGDEQYGDDWAVMAEALEDMVEAYELGPNSQVMLSGETVVYGDMTLVERMALHSDLTNDTAAIAAYVRVASDTSNLDDIAMEEQLNSQLTKLQAEAANYTGMTNGTGVNETVGELKSSLWQLINTKVADEDEGVSRAWTEVSKLLTEVEKNANKDFPDDMVSESTGKLYDTMKLEDRLNYYDEYSSNSVRITVPPTGAMTSGQLAWNAVMTADVDGANAFNDLVQQIEDELLEGEEEEVVIPDPQVFSFHVGPNQAQTIEVEIAAMNIAALGMSGLSTTTKENASAALAMVDAAVEILSVQRASLGAAQNRLEHTIKNVDNTSENLQSAESNIRDTNMATEMLELTKYNILSQASQAMLAQANQIPQQVLQLLQ